MKTKTNFTPILLNKDIDRIQSILKDTEESIKKLNKALRTAESFLETILKDDEATELLNTGFKYIMARIRKESKFPNSTDGFILEAIGKNPSRIKEDLSSCSAIFNSYQYEVKNGFVQLSEDGIDAIEHQYTQHTTNAKQNEAYQLAEQLVSKLNEVQHLGYANRSDFYQVQKGLKLVTLPDGPEGKMKVDFRYISKIREDGSIMSMY